MTAVVVPPTIVTTLIKAAFITVTVDLVQPDLTLTFAMFSTAGIDRPVTANIKLSSTVFVFRNDSDKVVFPLIALKVDLHVSKLSAHNVS